MIVEAADLQLEGYYINELHCSAQQVEEGKPPLLALTPGLHVQSPKPMSARPYPVLFQIHGGKNERNPSRFLVELRVSSDDKAENRGPYRFDVLIVGYFRVHTKPSSDAVPFLLRNAAMILYSSVRELLASVTGRGPFPAIVLPTMTFEPDREVGRRRSELPEITKALRRSLKTAPTTKSHSRKIIKKK